ncbi:hypothetical protein [Rhodoferax sp.]|uniref:hypothetical protein n=1 Tax=Rhodoferax sp. TaxID=50421 RepID=UPI00275FC6FD|nr:hypothetical protein [Rhodoferax sp.]
MRYILVVLLMVLGSMTSAVAQVSVGIGISLPGVSIGINLPTYPDLVPVPGYPVYYAPQVDSNYFFYDGMYWVYQNDYWYVSSWYNGPWSLVTPQAVPVFILRIPVRYYRVPPVYFRNWRPDAPPRWGDHWGRDWDHHRRGWDRWDHRSAPPPAPLPIYQRRYFGDQYPHAEQQPSLQGEHYRYKPRDPVVRKHNREQDAQRGPTFVPYVQQGDASSPPTAQPRRPAQRDAQRAPAPSTHVQQGDASSPPPPSPDSRQPAPQGRVKDRDKGDDRGKDRNR